MGFALVLLLPDLMRYAILISGSISCRNYALDGVITYNFTFANKRRGNKGVNRVHKCGLCREVHSRWCMKKHYADAHSGSQMPEAFELK